MQFPALTQENRNRPCPSALSITIDFYHNLDPLLIRRSSAAEVVIIFIRMTNAQGAQRMIDILNVFLLLILGENWQNSVEYVKMCYEWFDWFWSGGNFVTIKWSKHVEIFGICGNPCTQAFIFLTERKKMQKHELTEKENMQEQNRQCKTHQIIHNNPTDS